MVKVPPRLPAVVLGGRPRTRIHVFGVPWVEGCVRVGGCLREFFFADPVSWVGAVVLPLSRKGPCFLFVAMSCLRAAGRAKSGRARTRGWAFSCGHGITRPIGRSRCRPGVRDGNRVQVGRYCL